MLICSWSNDLQFWQMITSIFKPFIIGGGTLTRRISVNHHCDFILWIENISPCHIFFSSCNHKSWLVFLFTVTKHSPLKSLQNLDFYMDNLERNILGHLFLIYQPANFQWQIIFFVRFPSWTKKLLSGQNLLISLLYIPTSIGWDHFTLTMLAFFNK